MSCYWLILPLRHPSKLVFFFFNDTATTEIYTLSLHDALPISFCAPRVAQQGSRRSTSARGRNRIARKDRKSTRLNSSHSQISYAVFCLKKKNKLPNILCISRLLSSYTSR